MNKCKEEQLKGGEKEMKDDVTQNFPGEEPTYKKGGKTMKTKMKKLMKNQKGMTLIELLAVIVIIAIIALIAIPAIGNIINNSKDKAILADASSIISGAKIAVQDGACEESTDGKTITCNKDALEDYAENVKENANYSASKTDDGWSVTYTKFSDIKNKEFKPDNLKENTVTEKDLNKALGKSNTKKAEDKKDTEE